MARNNLRIIYQNLADSSNTTISASSTASGSTSTANLKKDTKSLVWRAANCSSLTNVRANLLVDLGSSQLVGGVVLPFTNLSPNAQIRVVLHSTLPAFTGSGDSASITNGTVVYNSGFILASPYQVLGLWNWGAIPLGVNSYSYGGGSYARAWFPSIYNARWITIEIIDNRDGTGISSLFVEASRLVIGSYWSPKFNTSFGLATQMKDLSTHARTESGDMITNIGTKFNSMNFDLKWLDPSDRLEFTRIIKGGGTPRPLLISLFPHLVGDTVDVDYEKEQSHQIYGKLADLGAVTNHIVNMYSTTVNIEEI